VNAGGTGKARLAALDGLRGLAVAAVVLYHSQFGFARGGYLGVSLFFTLSGFLITSLLLTRGREQHRVQLASFWARRARRLLPAATLALAGVLVYGATIATTDQLRDLRVDVLSTLGYVANWRFYLSGQSYARLFSAPSPVLHFWSLAIEEQFYLVFPLLVALVMWGTRGRRRVLGAVLFAGIVASVLAGRVLYRTSGSSRVYYGTDTRAAELLIGALLAVIVAGRVAPIRPTSTRVRAAATVAGAGALGVMIWWWATVDQTAPWLYRGGLALHACCAATVIAVARVEGPLARALSWRPLARLGLISYGVYLFHWPVFLWLSADRTGLTPVPLLALRLTVTLTIAIASFVFVEQPILRGRRVRGAYPKVVIPATAIAMVAALVMITTELPTPTIVLAPLSTQPSALRLTHVRHTKMRVRAVAASPAVSLHRSFSESRPLRIMVVGDSVGLSFGRGLELWAAATGGAIVQNDAIRSCSLGRHLRVRLPFGQEVPVPQACAEWDTKWPETIASFDPDVVVVLYTIWEIEWRQLPDGRWGKPGEADFDRWQLSEYQTATDILSARGAKVLWLNTACEGTPIKPHDLFWIHNNQTLPKLAASRSAAHIVDMDHLMCPHGPPNPDFGGVHDVRPDGSHFCDAGGLAVAGWFMPFVLGEKRAPPRYFPRFNPGLAGHVPLHPRRVWSPGSRGPQPVAFRSVDRRLRLRS
jgi:peptidoglycan/LPS O-acetylase OafA/YrhL